MCALDVSQFRNAISDTGSSLILGPPDAVEPFARAVGAQGPDGHVRNTHCLVLAESAIQGRPKET